MIESMAVKEFRNNFLYPLCVVGALVLITLIVFTILKPIIATSTVINVLLTLVEIVILLGLAWLMWTYLQHKTVVTLYADRIVLTIGSDVREIPISTVTGITEIIAPMTYKEFGLSIQVEGREKDRLKYVYRLHTTMGDVDFYHYNFHETDLADFFKYLETKNIPFHAEI